MNTFIIYIYLLIYIYSDVISVAESNETIKRIKEPMI